MSYPHNDPHQPDYTHGVVPSSLDSSNTDAVQAANSMAMITEGLLVHTRFSHQSSTIHW